jgi:hypothetical protein
LVVVGVGSLGLVGLALIGFFYYGRVSEDLRWSYMSPNALALVCARENTVQLKRLKRLANIAATEEMENMLT